MNWPDMIYRMVYTLFCTSLACTLVTGLVIMLAFLLIRIIDSRVKAGQKGSVGFFHPYCMDGFSILGEFIYWTDWQDRNIQRGEKEDGSSRPPILIIW